MWHLLLTSFVFILAITLQFNKEKVYKRNVALSVFDLGSLALKANALLHCHYFYILKSGLLWCSIWYAYIIPGFSSWCYIIPGFSCWCRYSYVCIVGYQTIMEAQWLFTCVLSWPLEICYGKVTTCFPPFNLKIIF